MENINFSEPEVTVNSECPRCGKKTKKSKMAVVMAYAMNDERSLLCADCERKQDVADKSV